MNISETGIQLIKKFEGCSLKAYKCPAEIWTIGYGHTSGVKEGQTITREQAEELLIQDLRPFEIGVNNLVNVPLNQNKFDALVSFCYNLGTGNLKKSTLLKLLNKGDYNGAAEQFDRWVYAGGKKLNGLVKRRAAEKKLFLTKVTVSTKYKVTANALNVRTGPGQNYKRIKLIYRNELVEIIHTENNWGLLINDGGWVNMSYLEKNNEIH